MICSAKLTKILNNKNQQNKEGKTIFLIQKKKTPRNNKTKASHTLIKGIHRKALKQLQLIAFITTTTITTKKYLKSVAAATAAEAVTEELATKTMHLKMQLKMSVKCTWFYDANVS